VKIPLIYTEGKKRKNRAAKMQNSLVSVPVSPLARDCQFTVFVWLRGFSAG